MNKVDFNFNDDNYYGINDITISTYSSESMIFMHSTTSKAVSMAVIISRTVSAIRISLKATLLCK